MKDYVAGLVFNADKNQVVLILKNRGGQRVEGYWNAVGGKVEPGEQPLDAMVREFKEETGAVTFPSAWNYFLELTAGEYHIHFYRLSNHGVFSRVLTNTDETVCQFNVYVLPQNVMNNLRWIIPMALTLKGENGISYYAVKERQ